MSQLMDDLLKDKLLEDDLKIPESYDKKIEETIEEIRNMEEKKKKVHWIFRSKAACAAMIILAISVVSVSSYAAVNLYKQRMASMSQKKIEKYNDDIQKSHTECDKFSRKLTSAEEKKMIRFREQYKKNGLFPQNEIKQYETNTGVAEGELCYVADETKFYLPEQSLSDEQLLEIVDLQEKIDYSLQQENAEVEQSDVGAETAKPLEETATSMIAKLYGQDEKQIKTSTKKNKDGSYEITANGKNMTCLVSYSEKKVLESVTYQKGNIPAHQKNAKITKHEIESAREKLQKKAETFMGQKVTSVKAYAVVNKKNELAYGTISYYCVMADGSGCVGVYSRAYDDLYDMYTIQDKKTMQKEISGKVRSSQNSGERYKELFK